MKRILITGAGSYIGTSVEKWLMKPEFSGMYQVDTVDMLGDGWKKKDFSSYDSIFHVAGIAHADVGKISEKQKELYYKVNCELAAETAKKAKLEGVKQFIYMSSIIVYGEGTSIRKKRVITRETKPSPSNFYGDSKWQAEQKLTPLDDENFHVAILRPPMIYGEGGKGNYVLLKKIALSFPLFPDFPNLRSMCSVQNLCKFVKRTVDNLESGLFFPQDNEWIKTADLVKKIANEHGKKIFLVKGFNWIINLLGLLPGKPGKMVNKAFGSLIYDVEKREKHPHILVITQYFYPEQFRINDICKEWVKRGYKVTVLTGIPNYPQGKFYKGYGYKKQRRTDFQGVDVIRLPIFPRGKGSIRISLNYLSFVVSGWLWAYFTKMKTDFVFTYEVSPMTQALVGVWFSKRRKIPAYLYVTDLWPENIIAVTGLENHYIIYLLQKMVDYIYKNCQMIFTSSESFIKIIEKRGINKNRLMFWPQYAEDFYRPVCSKENVFGTDAFNITFAGNIGEAQGLDVLISTAQKLKRRNFKVRFNIIGDGRYKSQLIKNVEESALQEYFLFFKKKLPERIPEYLAASDILLICLAKNPVFSITLPAKTQSCLACGKPILVAADGEIQNVITRAHCGFCSDAGDSEQLSQNIIKMIQIGREERMQLGTNALKYSKQFFDKERLLNQMDIFFREERDV